jgi:hypothetical protein
MFLKFQEVGNRHYVIKHKKKIIHAKISYSKMIGHTIFPDINYLKTNLKLDTQSIYNLERKLFDNDMWGDNKEKIILLSDLKTNWS